MLCHVVLVERHRRFGGNWCQCLEGSRNPLLRWRTRQVHCPNLYLFRELHSCMCQRTVRNSLLKCKKISQFFGNCPRPISLALRDGAKYSVVAGFYIKYECLL